MQKVKKFASSTNTDKIYQGFKLGQQTLKKAPFRTLTQIHFANGLPVIQVAGC